MNDDTKKRMKEFVEASEVISNYLIQQVRTGAINQALYRKNIERFVIALNEMKVNENEWK